MKKLILLLVVLFGVIDVNAQADGITPFLYHEGAELYKVFREKEYDPNYGEMENDVEWILYNDKAFPSKHGISDVKMVIEKFREGVAYHTEGTVDGVYDSDIISVYYVHGTPVNYNNKQGQRVTEATVFDADFRYYGFYHTRGKVHRFIIRTTDGIVRICEAVRM